MWIKWHERLVIHHTDYNNYCIGLDVFTNLYCTEMSIK